MPFANESWLTLDIKRHFQRKKVDYNEGSLINVLLNEQSSKNDVWYAVLGLRDVGTEKCIPYLKKLVNYPKQDVKDCSVITISHLVGVNETNFYIGLLQRKKYRKGYPLLAILASADERAIEPVISYLEPFYKKLSRPANWKDNGDFIDALRYLYRYYSINTDAKEMVDKFLVLKKRTNIGITDIKKSPF